MAGWLDILLLLAIAACVIVSGGALFAAFSIWQSNRQLRRDRQRRLRQ